MAAENTAVFLSECKIDFLEIVVLAGQQHDKHLREHDALLCIAVYKVVKTTSPPKVTNAQQPAYNPCKSSVTGSLIQQCH